jgi:hypothetical protein
MTAPKLSVSSFTAMPFKDMVEAVSFLCQQVYFLGLRVHAETLHHVGNFLDPTS